MILPGFCYKKVRLYWQAMPEDVSSMYIWFPVGENCCNSMKNRVFKAIYRDLLLEISQKKIC